jgi:hypothetical protein
LLRGEEKKVWGYPAYQGRTAAIHEVAPDAQHMNSDRNKFKNHVDEEAKRKNRTKSIVIAKAEWPLRILKRVFGFSKSHHLGRMTRPTEVVSKQAEMLHAAINRTRNEAPTPFSTMFIAER